MLFSVIIPIYNSGKTLQRCIDSIIQQAEGRAELILVNDGSTDNTDEICRDYCTRFSNIKYIAQKNKGVSSARNAGIQQARGEFVTFVDSDDYVTNDYFDTLQTELEADLLAFSGTRERDGKRFGEKIEIIKNEIKQCDMDQVTFATEYIRTRNGSPWNKRFKRSILCNKGIVFPSDLSVGEDFVFCLKYIMEIERIVIIHNSLYVVDESNDNSLTRKYNQNLCHQTLLVYEYSFDAISKSKLDEASKEMLKQILDYNYYRTSFACIKGLQKSSKTRIEKYKESKRILSAFAANERAACPMNIIHRLSKLVVNRRLAITAYAISAIHNRKRER